MASWRLKQWLEKHSTFFSNTLRHIPMAQHLQPNEMVYVPRMRVGLDGNSPSALVRAKVLGVTNRTAELEIPSLPQPIDVATSALHRNIGVLILRVGDYQTEHSLLDPLAKSVLQYFRLLLPDDMLRMCEIRTEEELIYYWNQLHAAYSHVVIVGHGRPNGILFGSDTWLTATQLVQTLQGANPSPKTFLSLCCNTGYADFAKEFSKAALCHALLAPYHSVHGATASLFCQSYFGFHFLDGNSVRVAFRHASKSIAGGIHFRLWQNGDLKEGR